VSFWFLWPPYSKFSRSHQARIQISELNDIRAPGRFCDPTLNSLVSDAFVSRLLHAVRGPAYSCRSYIPHLREHRIPFIPGYLPYRKPERKL
jgi:hypothetical protein